MLKCWKLCGKLCWNVDNYVEMLKENTMYFLIMLTTMLKCWQLCWNVESLLLNVENFSNHVENYVENVNNLFNVIVRVQSEAIFVQIAQKFSTLLCILHKSYQHPKMLKC